MRIINSKQTQTPTPFPGEQPAVLEEKSINAVEKTIFKATPPGYYSIHNFTFFQASLETLYLVHVGSYKRWTDKHVFSRGENILPRLLKGGWKNIEEIKGKVIKMELV